MKTKRADVDLPLRGIGHEPVEPGKSIGTPRPVLIDQVKPVEWQPDDVHAQVLDAVQFRRGDPGILIGRDQVIGGGSAKSLDQCLPFGVIIRELA